MADDSLPQSELLVYSSVYLKDKIGWDFLEVLEEEECSLAPDSQLQEQLPDSARDLEEEVLDEDALLELELLKQMEALGLPTAFSTTRFEGHPLKRKRTKKPKVPATESVSDEQKCSHLKIHTITSTVSESYAKLTPLPGSEQRENAEQDIPRQLSRGKTVSRKYWRQRYSLFTKFDEGVAMDAEGWFSVTPEAIARHQASRCEKGVILDGFTGVGGNAIQFALMGHSVLAVDINPEKIKFARHNAKLYGVEHLISFIVGDFFEVAPTLKADAVFLSPPWGGPEYTKHSQFNLDMLPLHPEDGYKLFETAQHVSSNIMLFLPRNVNVHQLADLMYKTNPPTRCEVESNYLNGHLKAKTAYYGDFSMATNETS